jgi:hypothetical protein
LENRLEIRLLVYATNVNKMGKSICATSKNTAALLVACKETVLEINVEKTKYVIMCREQNSKQNNQTNMRNKSFKVWNS